MAVFFCIFTEKNENLWKIEYLLRINAVWTRKVQSRGILITISLHPKNDCSDCFGDNTQDYCVTYSMFCNVCEFQYRFWNAWNRFDGNMSRLEMKFQTICPLFILFIFEVNVNKIWMKSTKQTHEYFPFEREYLTKCWRIYSCSICYQRKSSSNHHFSLTKCVDSYSEYLALIGPVVASLSYCLIQPA